MKEKKQYIHLHILCLPKADVQIIKHLPDVILWCLTHFSGYIKCIIGIRVRVAVSQIEVRIWHGVLCNVEYRPES